MEQMTSSEVVYLDFRSQRHLKVMELVQPKELSHLKEITLYGAASADKGKESCLILIRLLY